jgi:hypothetical protein
LGISKEDVYGEDESGTVFPSPVDTKPSRVCAQATHICGLAAFINVIKGDNNTSIVINVCYYINVGTRPS